MSNIFSHQYGLIDAAIADPAEGFLLGQRRRRCSADRVLGRPPGRLPLVHQPSVHLLPY